MLRSIIGCCILLSTHLQPKPVTVPVDPSNTIKIYGDQPTDGPAPHAALSQFSRLISRKNRQFDKKSKHHTHLAYAQVYFNDLYTHGSRDTQKTLTLLAFELESILAKRSWSTEKKYLTFNAFLTNAFGEIEQTLTTKPEKDKMQRLYKHLQAGISPTVIGQQEAIKNLPWKKIVAGTALVGAGYYGYQNGILKKTRDHVIKSFETFGHIGDNLREARRETLAFFANIQPTADNSGHIVEDKWVNTKTGAVINENPDGSIPPNAQRELRYLRKMPEDGDLESWKQSPENWVKKPEGISDRLMKVAQAATPLLPELATRLQDATAEQDHWFKTHGISTDRTQRLWVPIEKSDGSHEMRYAEDAGYTTQELTNQGVSEEIISALITAAQASKNSSAGYWKDAGGLWHKTHLPKRNIGEEALAVTEKLIDTLNSKHMKQLIARLTRDLTISEETLMSFLHKNGLLTADATKPSDLADGVSIDWNDAHTKMVYKRRDGTAVAIPESDFSRLITTANTLINQIGDKTTTTGSLVETLTASLNDSRKELNTWLLANGLAIDDKGNLAADVALGTDPLSGSVYYTKPDEFAAAAAGAGSGATTPPLKKFYPPMSPSGNLFNALGVLAKQEGISLEMILNRVFEEIDQFKPYIVEISTNIGNIGLGDTPEAKRLKYLSRPAVLARNGDITGARDALAQLNNELSSLTDLIRHKEERGILIRAIKNAEAAIKIKEAAIEAAKAEEAAKAAAKAKPKGK